MEDTIHDVLVIGTGPSALTAAVYTTRESIETVLYEKAVVGGMVAVTDMVENYPGFVDGIEGLNLASIFEKQAKKFGARIEYGEASSIVTENDYKVVSIDSKPVKAKVVLVATGSDWKKIGVPGESENFGRGVHYCATCDGAFYRDKKIVVVGGGNSAFQEALFLTRFVSHIDLLVRNTITASEILQTQLQKHVDAGKVSVHLNTSTKEIVAKDNKVIGVRAQKDGQEVMFDIDGVFVFVGLKPNTDFLKNSEIKLDEMGMIVTDEHLMTSMPGVFASGDVRSGATRQIASAVGEGAEVAISIREYLAELEHKS